MAVAVVNVFEATIAAGVLDLSPGTGIYHVETEGGAATDDLASVTGMAHPHVYELRIKTPGHYWTILHNAAGGIRLMYGTSFVTSNPDDKIVLRSSESGTYVFEFIERKVIPAT